MPKETLPQEISSSEVFDYNRWIRGLSALRQQYIKAQPYPHIVFDDFLNRDAVLKGVAEFPNPDSKNWIAYKHVNENKQAETDRSVIPFSLVKIINELNSASFIKFLSELTGIEGLFADETLEGGGLHQSPRGGFLNVHADFTVHPRHNNWVRRINVLVYLNLDWQDSYGGHLELWDRKMQACVKKVLPMFNRCLIFNTDEDSYHGLPDPIMCPQGMNRKSIALYYFTEAKDKVKICSTNYRSRPNDSNIKKIFIDLDKNLLFCYDRIKRKFGISDRLAGKILDFFSKFTSRK